MAITPKQAEAAHNAGKASRFVEQLAELERQIDELLKYVHDGSYKPIVYNHPGSLEGSLAGAIKTRYVGWHVAVEYFPSSTVITFTKAKDFIE